MFGWFQAFGEVGVTKKRSVIATIDVSCVYYVITYASNSLRQRRHCLAAYAVAALPVRLVLGEEDRSASKCVLLKDPATLCEVSVEDVFVEVIDHLTHVDGAVILMLRVQCDLMSGPSRREKA